jgi:hypothetical protein
MIRFVKRRARRRSIRTTRVTVAWQRGRVRRIKLEYVRPHLIRRVYNAVRW